MRITIPIAPKPQSRSRFNGRTKRAYEASAMTAYKRAVSTHIMAYKPTLLEKCPISVHVTFYVYPPKYIRTDKKLVNLLESEALYVDKKPDLDNYFKAVTDAAEGLLYKNDSQIAAITMQKLYSLDPRTEIEVEELK